MPEFAFTAYPHDIFVADKGRVACPIWVVTPDDFLEWREAHLGVMASWAESAKFKADAGEVLLVPDAGGNVAGVLLGIGTPTPAYPPDPLALAALPPRLPKGQYRLAESCPEQIRRHSALAWALGFYRFTAYKQEDEADADAFPQLVMPKDFDTARHNEIARSVYFVRDLINAPAEHMTPTQLASVATDLAKEFGAKCRIVSGDALLDENYPLIHAVGRAAADPPHLIDVTWGDAADTHITLVGKGVTFDTGGLNLKTGTGMGLMKKDMGGAATALGLARAIMALGLSVRLRVLIGAVENAIGPGAFRPGDILPSRKGLSVEIGNTDAEGRLVLADLLAEACDDAPHLLVDFATLTGAARVAMGPEVTPFYTRQDSLAHALGATADATADPMWHQPLWPPYDSWLSSRIADVNHISASNMAGSITAALFLARFVPEEQPWIHCDIYGWNNKARAGRSVGGEAQGLRAVLRLIETHILDAPDQ